MVLREEPHGTTRRTTWFYDGTDISIIWDSFEVLLQHTQPLTSPEKEMSSSSTVLIDCADLNTQIHGIKMVNVSKKDVGELLGAEIVVRTCTSCGLAETRDCSRDSLAPTNNESKPVMPVILEPQHPMAKIFKGIFKPMHEYGPWGLQAHEVTSCNLIGAVFIKSFRSYGLLNVDCPGCGCRSY